MLRILVTGGAGFIGYHLIKRLFSDDSNEYTIVSIDNLNTYYDIKLKEWRLKEIEDYLLSHRADRYVFIKGDIADKEFLSGVFDRYKPDIVINLAAQAGVRASIDHPDDYIKSNIIGFYNVLEMCRKHNVDHLVYASSSSVYGNSSDVPFKTESMTDSPVSLYAATKKSDELLAYAYSKLYEIPMTGLRFFSVYGPAGRPDMAYFKFADKLQRGEGIDLYNYGNCRRDFTYVDDIVEGICRVILKPPIKETGKDGLPVAPHKIYNIGGGSPVELTRFVDVLVDAMKSVGILSVDFNKEVYIHLVPMQAGDVLETYADTSPLEANFGFRPTISLEDGIREFIKWYAEWLKIREL